jgi:hypothetical protein
VIFLIAILTIIIFLAVSKIDTNAASDIAEIDQKKASKKHVQTQTIVVLVLFLAAGIGGYNWRSNNIASQGQATLAGQLNYFFKF